MEETTLGKRIFALDAMRGLAAFVVIWYHFRRAFVAPELPWYLLPFFAGTQAVVLFFVLSGYVLSLPYWRGRQLPYSRYLVRRFFRIYVPYLAAMLVALVGASQFMNAKLPLTPWFYLTWHTPITAGLVARSLLMNGGAALNSAFWSLRYEMQMSIVFPFMCWLLNRLRPLGTLAFGILVAAMGAAIPSASFRWGSCFIFGALLAWEQDRIRNLYKRTPASVKCFALALVVIAYFSDSTPATTFGSCGALIFAQHSRASRWLNTAIPEYLGRVSYSMYLIHGTVLQATLILLYPRMSVSQVAVIFFMATMAASHLFCIFVEEPAMRMGRRLTAYGKQINPIAVESAAADL